MCWRSKIPGRYHNVLMINGGGGKQYTMTLHKYGWTSWTMVICSTCMQRPLRKKETMGRFWFTNSATGFSQLLYFFMSNIYSTGNYQRQKCWLISLSCVHFFGIEKCFKVIFYETRVYSYKMMISFTSSQCALWLNTKTGTNKISWSI